MPRDPASALILRARIVVTMDGPPVENGAVLIERQRIAAVGEFDEVRRNSSAPVLDLGEQVLLPGLINAHCHLDYTMMRHALAPPSSFTAWVQRINALKRMLDSDDYIDGIRRGFAELQRWGTTTVCNIEAFPELMPLLPPSPIRTWWFYEMIDIRHRHATEEVVAGALTFFQNRARGLDRFGLSPHAPYTASRELYQLANECAGNLIMPLTTHVAESREEFEMFRYCDGALYEFMESLERPMTDCGSLSPFGRLWSSGSVNGDWILVHMNELVEEDFQLLARLAPKERPTVVHCPGSHHYFGHSPFAWRRLHELGVNLCTATDSLASTDTLSLLQELRRLHGAEPWIEPEELLRTVTVHPARALQRGDSLGILAPGAAADLIALPASGRVTSIHEEILQCQRPIPWMMIDGQVCC